MTKNSLLAFAILLTTIQQVDAIVYCPPGGARIWDPSIMFHDGRYYAFSMYRPPGHKQYDSVGLAISEDGVHWIDQGPVITDDMTVLKCFVARCGDRFVLNHGSYTNFEQDRLKFYTSDDLIHWKYLGDSHPDPRWYDPHKRWDDMYFLPKEEGKPEKGFWGYATAHPRDCPKLAIFGLLESDDGLEWRSAPAPRIEWGGMTPAFLENGGCERFGDKYYFLAGGCYGNMYGMFTFVADDPQGPFRPDVPCFQLCNNRGYAGLPGLTWLAAFARGRDGEVLVSNYLSTECISNAEVWMLPLRKAVVDPEGHLRLAYWPGNETAKGKRVSPKTLNFVRLGRPTKESGADEETETLQLRAGQVPLNELFGDRFSVARSATPLDLDRGVILECKLTASLPARVRPRVGFVIEEAQGSGMAGMLEVGQPWRRRSWVGRLDYRPLFESASQDLLGDKTLVCWCRLANLDQRAGAPMAIEEDGAFDAIVFAECQAKTWMAGSDFFRRTLPDQAGWRRVEAVDQLVQIAVTYAGRQITIYRNGETVASYEIDEPASFSTTPCVVFGKRMRSVSDSFTGALEEARLYGCALSKEQLKSLRPGAVSEPPPLGWWDFEGNEVTDRTGNFPTGKLLGGARLVDGAMHLAADGACAVVEPPVETTSFTPIDEIGEGCASVRGIDPNVPATLRLWIRWGMFEFYVNDRLVQTGIYDRNKATGRLGFVTQSCDLRVSDLAIWKMNFNDPEEKGAVNDE